MGHFRTLHCPITDQHGVQAQHTSGACTLSATVLGVSVFYLYVIVIAEMRAHYVVQTSLKFLGSCDPLASASGMAGIYKCIQKALVSKELPFQFILF